MEDNPPIHLLPDWTRKLTKTFRGGRKRYRHMKDESHSCATASLRDESADIQRLARAAIAVLAAYGSGGSRGAIRRLEEFIAAVISSDEGLRHEVVLHLRQSGVPVDDIIDLVIPAVARVLGDRWANDINTFLDVTIGTARLQEAVRELGWHDRARQRIPADAPVILMIIPRGEEHTLGAFILADQWRRLGVWVDLAIHHSPREIAAILRKGRHDMVAITAAGRGTLAPVRELVEITRRTAAQATPIVMGGAILDRDMDVLAATGADHVAASARSALNACGLIHSGREAPPRKSTGQVGARHDRQ